MTAIYKQGEQGKTGETGETGKTSSWNRMPVSRKIPVRNKESQKNRRKAAWKQTNVRWEES